MIDKTECKHRIGDALKDRLEDFNPNTNNDFLSGNYGDDFGQYLREYGLCFDYVEPATFNDQVSGYFRWQLSYGGPSDEFRLYPQSECIEYVFMDWFDGATEALNRADKAVVIEALQKFEIHSVDFWARLRQRETLELDKIDREGLAFSHA